MAGPADPTPDEVLDCTGMACPIPVVKTSQAIKKIGQGQVLDHETIGKIAARHGQTPAQVILRWNLQHGNIVVVKTLHRDRMQTNLEVLRFELTDQEMDAIDALDNGEAGRIGPNPDTYDWVP